MGKRTDRVDDLGRSAGPSDSADLRALTALRPPGTNRQYFGSRYAASFLALYGVGWLVPGLIDSFVPDGGAGTIAGL